MSEDKKREMRFIATLLICMLVALIVTAVSVACHSNKRSDETISRIDREIERYEESKR